MRERERSCAEREKSPVQQKVGDVRERERESPRMQRDLMQTRAQRDWETYLYIERAGAYIERESRDREQRNLMQRKSSREREMKWKWKTKAESREWY